jgi:hypothetical protein
VRREIFADAGQRRRVGDDVTPYLDLVGAFLDEND